MRLAMSLVVEEALEAKVRDMLGRDYYVRSGSREDGYRNGYRQDRLKTAEGEVRGSRRRSFATGPLDSGSLRGSTPIPVYSRSGTDPRRTGPRAR